MFGTFKISYHVDIFGISLAGLLWLLFEKLGDFFHIFWSLCDLIVNAPRICGGGL